MDPRVFEEAFIDEKLAFATHVKSTKIANFKSTFKSILSSSSGPYDPLEILKTAMNLSLDILKTFVNLYGYLKIDTNTVSNAAEMARVVNRKELFNHLPQAGTPSPC